MASHIDIINRALAKLGDFQITSLDQDDKRANLARTVYEPARDSELQSHEWNFARDRAMLPALAEAPAFDWAYQYQLPSDFLRVTQAGPWPGPAMAPLVGEDTSAYAIEGDRILSNYGPPLKLVYVRRVTDAGIYPPLFVDALACRLAMEMCETLTGSNAKRQLAMQEYQLAVTAARRVNAIQRPPQAVQDDSWMAARLAGIY